MTFLAPNALWGLLAVPALAALYASLMWRRGRSRPADLAVVDTRRNRAVRTRRRHLPAGLFLVALTVLLVGLARPEAEVTLPTRTGRIVLAFDTSNSMVADDVEPTRLDVAKRLALAFVDRQPRSVQIGVVAFTDGGLIVQPTTDDQDDVRAAIDRLTTDGGTSIAEGIFAALTAIAEEPIDLGPDGGSAIDLAAVDMGERSNAAIIVFTDGEDLGGADPMALAALSAESGVPVYTVGVGTRRGTVVPLDGFSIATALDEAMLADIAESTGGRYHLAADDPDLTVIFDEIDRSFERRNERTEITALFSMAAIVLILAAAGLSLRWSGRI